MWMSLVLTALTLAPAQQAGGMRLTNDRLTYGTLGPVRTESKYLPGDVFSMTFDIEGLKTTTGNKALYSLSFQVTDAKGKLVYGEDPRDLEAILHFGGGKLPASPFWVIAPDQQPGVYEFKMTVRDQVAKVAQTMTRKFEVLPKAFGLVALQISNGQVQSPPTGAVGQEMFLNFAIVGFERDKAKRQPHVNLELNIFDQAKKPTLDKPISGSFSENIPDNVVAVPTYFLLKLNRGGTFTVELKATDTLTKKTSTLSIPIRILE